MATRITRRALPNVHPGEVLALELLEPLGLSQSGLARALGVPPRRTVLRATEDLLESSAACVLTFDGPMAAAAQESGPSVWPSTR